MNIFRAYAKCEWMSCCRWLIGPPRNTSETSLAPTLEWVPDQLMKMRTEQMQWSEARKKSRLRGKGDCFYYGLRYQCGVIFLLDLDFLPCLAISPAHHLHVPSARTSPNLSWKDAPAPQLDMLPDKLDLLGLVMQLWTLPISGCARSS